MEINLGEDMFLSFVKGETMNAQLVKKSYPAYRKFDVVTLEGNFIVEYNGHGVGYETVLVNGEVVAQHGSQTGMTPLFRFNLGTQEASIEIGSSMGTFISSFKLTVGGQALYKEGHTEKISAKLQKKGAYKWQEEGGTPPEARIAP